jgi:SNF2 family DNA or RNA helicase
MIWQSAKNYGTGEKFMVDLWQHQRYIIDRALDTLFDRGYHYWDVGCSLGKTIASLTVQEALPKGHTLVLTTKSGVEQAWAQQPAEHFADTPLLSLIGGTTKDKAARYIEFRKLPYGITVVNYESFVRMGDVFQKYPPQTIIADESHKLKAAGGRTSRLLCTIPAKYRLAMTGTAWEDSPLDVYGQLRWLAPARNYTSSILGSWSSFFQEYAIYYTIGHNKIPKAFKNLDRLAKIMASFTTILRTEDVYNAEWAAKYPGTPVLPPAHHDIHWLDMTSQMRSLYETMCERMLARDSGQIMVADNPLVNGLRLHMLTSGLYTGTHHESGTRLTEADARTYEGGNVKLDRLIDLLDEIGKRKVVIFTRFTQDVDRIKAAVDRPTFELTGRAHEHLDFIKAKDGILIANINAGSASVDLTVASHCIFYTLDWARSNYVQALARVRRPESKHPVTYHYLLVRNSIDGLIYDTLQRKGGNERDLRQAIGKHLTENL